MTKISGRRSSRSRSHQQGASNTCAARGTWDCLSVDADVTRHVRRPRFVAVSVIPNPPGHSPGLLSSGEGLDVPQKVDKPQHKRIRTRNRDQEASQSLCQPSQSPMPRAKATGAQRSICSRTVPAKKFWHLCSGCYRFFLFRHVVVPLGVSTEPRGLGAGLDRSFRHMSHACSEPRARSSRSRAQTLVEDDTKM